MCVCWYGVKYGTQIKDINLWKLSSTCMVNKMNNSTSYSTLNLIYFGKLIELHVVYISVYVYRCGMLN